MNEEDYVEMSEKILKQIYSLITENKTLCEFYILPCNSADMDRNVSPVKHLWEEQCLGLYSWCAGYIFKQAQKKALQLRKCKHPQDLNIYLTGALLIQPEVTTFWNIKREIFKHLDVETEYRFSRLVLSFKPKSFEAFRYRQFIISKILHKHKENELHDILITEQKVLENSCNNTPNNYHAWNHRIWCFQNIVLLLSKSILIEELNFSKNWISNHVSEHSGFHYRQHVLNSFQHEVLPNHILSSLTVFNTTAASNTIYSYIDPDIIDKLEESYVVKQNQFLCLIINELYSTLPALHMTFPGHESLWYHRRYAMYHVHSILRKIYKIEPKCILSDYNNLPVDVNIINACVNINITKQKSHKQYIMESSTLYKMILSTEKKFLLDVSNCDEWKQNDIDLLNNYKKWLYCILSFEV